MQIAYEIHHLSFEYPFIISRETKTAARTVILNVCCNYNNKEYTGIGEAVPAKYYGEDAETVIRFYDLLTKDNSMVEFDPFNIQEFAKIMDKYPGNIAAKSGLNMAIYDLQGKIAGMPLYKLWGLDPLQVPKTSYTIGIADTATVKAKTEKAKERGFDILKIKLGSENDIEALEAIKKVHPGATIRVDANAAWNLEEAIEMLKILKDHEVEFVEEPLKTDTPDADRKKLKESSPLMIMADEKCHTLKDMPFCAEYYHAVNLKLPKTGGLTEAIRMIHAARAHNMKIMLGCFAETSVSITAFAHLSPLADYADLDGSILIKDDPYKGVEIRGSKMILPDGDGLGVK